VRRLSALKDSAVNEAKAVLAFETTQLIHGTQAAEQARQASASLFGGGADSANVPTSGVTRAQLAEDGRVTTLLALCGLTSSRGEARKMVQQGAVYVGESKVEDVDARLTEADFPADGLLLRKGKKSFCKLVLQ